MQTLNQMPINRCRKILDNLAAHLQSIRDQFTSPIDQELIQQQNTSVREYGQLLLDLAKPNADQVSIYKRMGQLGDLLLDTTQKAH
nr:hypothetical protein GCM10020185_32890 [Pseudomonas brassicacearum subsp. brassicacearum]